MIDIVSTANATDDFIQSLIEDDKWVTNPDVVQKIHELRVEHKQTLKCLEDLYKEQVLYENHSQNFTENRKSHHDVAYNEVNWDDFEDLDFEYPAHDSVKFQQQLQYRQNARERFAVDDGASSSSCYMSELAYNPYEQWSPTNSGRKLTTSIRWQDQVYQERFEESTQYRGYGQRSSLTSSKSSDDISNHGHWQPKITVPVPFQMTIREESVPHRMTYAKRHLKEQLEEKQREQSVVQGHKFRAHPVPSNTFLPLYEEMQHEHDARERFRRVHSQERLNHLQDPFPLSVTKQAAHIRHCAPVTDHGRNCDDTPPFKATPIPAAVAARKYALYPSSGPQSEITVDGRHISLRHKQCLHASRDAKMKPRKKLPPDFKRIHEQLENKMDTLKKTSTTTVCEPFSLTPVDKLKHHQHDTEKPEAFKSTPYEPPKRLPEYRANTAHQLRLQAMNENKEVYDASMSWLREYLDQKKEWEQEFREKLRDIYDLDKLKRLKEQSNLNELKKSQREQQKEYREKMEEINFNLKSKPTIIERQALLIKRQSLETKYKHILDATGVTELKLEDLDDLASVAENALNLEPRAASVQSSKSSSLTSYSSKFSDGSTKSSAKAESEKGSKRSSAKSRSPSASRAGSIKSNVSVKSAGSVKSIKSVKSETAKSEKESRNSTPTRSRKSSVSKTGKNESRRSSLNSSKSEDKKSGTKSKTSSSSSSKKTFTKTGSNSDESDKPELPVDEEK